MLVMSRDSLYLKDALENLQEARVKEVKHLEVQLQSAVRILKDAHLWVGSNFTMLVRLSKGFRTCRCTCYIDK